MYKHVGKRIDEKHPNRKVERGKTLSSSCFSEFALIQVQDDDCNEQPVEVLYNKIRNGVCHAVCPIVAGYAGAVNYRPRSGGGSRGTGFGRPR